MRGLDNIYTGNYYTTNADLLLTTGLLKIICIFMCLKLLSPSKEQKNSLLGLGIYFSM